MAVPVVVVGDLHSVGGGLAGLPVQPVVVEAGGALGVDPLCQVAFGVVDVADAGASWVGCSRRQTLGQLPDVSYPTKNTG